MISTKVVEGNIESGVVFVDGIVVTLEATTAFKPTVALGTWDHWSSEGNSRVSDGICLCWAGNS